MLKNKIVLLLYHSYTYLCCFVAMFPPALSFLHSFLYMNITLYYQKPYKLILILSYLNDSLLDRSQLDSFSNSKSSNLTRSLYYFQFNHTLVSSSHESVL